MAIAFLVLAWFFIALRVWTRTYVIANFGWDDTTMLLAGVGTRSFHCTLLKRASPLKVHRLSSLSTAQRCLFSRPTAVRRRLPVFRTWQDSSRYGDVADHSQADSYRPDHQWTIIGEASYLATIMVLKISLGIFFGRIVVVPWHLRVIYITVIVSILSNASAFVYVLLRCGPDLDQYLYVQIQDKCTPRTLDNFFAYQQAALTTLTDLVFAALPFFILWNTNMDLRSKISVGFILSLAGLYVD